ncbi:unnamed protein product, partial [Symbiodinium sp. CCMP2456]
GAGQRGYNSAAGRASLEATSRVKRGCESRLRAGDLLCLGHHELEQLFVMEPQCDLGALAVFLRGRQPGTRLLRCREPKRSTLWMSRDTR